MLIKKKMPATIHYMFTQHFEVPAKTAYIWCTSFSAEDFSLINQENTKREIVHLTDEVLILRDRYKTGQGWLLKEKLIHLYPEKLAWTSTHLSGPNKHSQFMYEIKAETKQTSYLVFIANHVEYQENVNCEDVCLLAEKCCSADSDVWSRLAEALNKQNRKISKP